PQGRAAVGLVLSRHRAVSGVSGPRAVRHRRLAVTARMLRIRAGTVHPVTAPPIADGAVLVDDRGKLAAVGPAATVPAPDGARLLEFPDGAIVPGLVNCHTHLELTHLAGRNPERGFPRWIRAIRALKDATTPEELYRAVAALARRDHFPIAVHIAESQEETLLVRDGLGPFAEALWDRGIAVARQDCSPVQYLERLGVLSPETLCIHCVQVDAQDVKALRHAGAAIAHCPRSNSAHGHGAAPLPAVRAAGLRVGVGTDSVVSVGDLDLIAETRAAGLSGEDALSVLTLEGATALGLENEI